MELKERDTEKECEQNVFDVDGITCICGSDMTKMQNLDFVLGAGRD